VPGKVPMFVIQIDALRGLSAPAAKANPREVFHEF